MKQCECPQYGSDRLRFRGRIEQNIALNTKNAQLIQRVTIYICQIYGWQGNQDQMEQKVIAFQDLK